MQKKLPDKITHTLKKSISCDKIKFSHIKIFFGISQIPPGR